MITDEARVQRQGGAQGRVHALDVLAADDAARHVRLVRHHQEVPDDRLKGFGVRRDVRRVHRRDDHAGVRHLCGVTVGAANHAANGRAHGLRVPQRGNQIRADLFFEVAAAHREHQHAILGAEAADAQPRFEHRRPSFVVGAGSQLGDVVCRAVGFMRAVLFFSS